MQGHLRFIPDCHSIGDVSAVVATSCRSSNVRSAALPATGPACFRAALQRVPASERHAWRWASPTASSSSRSPRSRRRRQLWKNVQARLEKTPRYELAAITQPFHILQQRLFITCTSKSGLKWHHIVHLAGFWSCKSVQLFRPLRLIVASATDFAANHKSLLPAGAGERWLHAGDGRGI